MSINSRPSASHGATRENSTLTCTGSLKTRCLGFTVAKYTEDSCRWPKEVDWVVGVPSLVLRWSCRPRRCITHSRFDGGSKLAWPLWPSCCPPNSGTRSAPTVSNAVTIEVVAKSTSIEWTDHTFNPWWGCTKVSPGCDHCYAELWARRVGESVWGRDEPRRFFSDAHWRQPRAWNSDAMERGERRRVFCASMADVFEDRRDLDSERERLWRLITETPNLDWQLLTKRPQNVCRLSPWQGEWPKNVWLGTTVEDQVRADLRVPILLRVPASVRFLSCEPLLGPVDLSVLVGAERHIHWIIAGGESGPGARPMDPTWVRRLRDFCRASHIAFHFKQWGHWAPKPPSKLTPRATTVSDGVVLYAVGKKLAGRNLDGRTWDQLPTAQD